MSWMLHAEPRRRRAVDGDIGLQAALLAVGGDVGDAGDLLHPVQHLAAPKLCSASISELHSVN